MEWRATFWRGISGGLNFYMRVSFCLFCGRCFLRFWSIFARFGQFRPNFRPDFSFFHFFSVFDDGILERRMRPCTYTHPTSSFPYTHWAHLDPEKSLTEEVLAGNGLFLCAPKPRPPTINMPYLWPFVWRCKISEGCDLGQLVN